MSSRHQRAPAWARTILRRLFPGRRGEEIRYELDLEYLSIRERRSGPYARTWYFTQLLRPTTWRLAWALRRTRRAEGREPDPTSTPGRDNPKRRTANWHGGIWGHGLSLDLKLAGRMLLKYPGLTAVSVVSIAFGVAVGAVVFQGLTDLYHPRLGLPESHRIVEINEGEDRQVLHDFATWREELASVRGVSAYGTVRRNLVTEDHGSQPLTIAEINASGLRTAGVPPLLGRLLQDADEEPAAPAVLVISYQVWHTRFGADPDIVGRSVRVGTMPTTVVGVMPEGFAFPMNHEAWAPLRLNPMDYPRGEGPTLDVFGRLAPGVSLSQAQAELNVRGERAAAQFPRTNAHRRPVVQRYRGGFLHGGEGLILGAYSFMAALPVLVLLLVAANVALLVFARTAGRESEIAVRRALGASRERIVLQLFLEALTLAGLGGAVGLAAADSIFARLLGAMGTLEGPLPYWFHPGLSGATVLYASLFTLAGALVVGLVPALKVMPGALRGRLAASTAGAGGLHLGGIWSGVIVTQIAVTITLVPFVVLALRTGAPAFWPEARLPLAEFLSASLQPTLEVSSDAEPSVPESEDVFHAACFELKERLSATPGVRGVTFSTDLPGSPPRFRRMEIDGVETPMLRTGVIWIDRDYTEVFSLPLSAGRTLVPPDFQTDARVALVNESFVQDVLEGRQPVGRRVRFPTPQQAGDGEPAEEAPWYEIVGVVSDTNTRVGSDAAGEDQQRIFLPMARSTYPVRMAVHVAGDPATMLPQVRRLAADVNPSLLLRVLVPLVVSVAAGEALMAIILWTMILAGGLALLIANAGIYAAMSFAVARRRREIGVRVALGAGRARLIGAILGRALRQLALGLLAGGALLFLIMRYFSGEGLLLWWDDAASVSSLEAVASVLAYATFMLAVCVVASVVPTRRALAIQPTEALKADG